MPENEGGVILDRPEQLRALADFKPIDLHFASLCGRVSESGAGVVSLVAAAVSRSLREGHSCLELRSLAGTCFSDAERVQRFSYPDLDSLRSALKSSSAVKVASHPASLSSRAVSGADSCETPLVLDENDRVYVARFFQHEQLLAQALSRLLRRESGSSVDEKWLASRLQHYFLADRPASGDEENLQMTAAAAALRSRFCVISGGPGTGKTSTVVKVLALLAEQAKAAGEEFPSVQLMAPTGKAAARMVEAIESAVAGLGFEADIEQSIARQASTIHRALGVLPHNATRFSRGSGRPLRSRVVLVDEASMVDLSLMRHLVGALDEGARLILLGDRHQLASVDAGSVLAELCAALRQAGQEYSSSLVELKKSYRFSEDSGIYALAEAIRQGDGDAAVAVLASRRDDLHHDSSEAEPSDSSQLRQLVVTAYGRALKKTNPREVLSEMNRFRVLCAHRKGPRGVEVTNEQIRRWLVRSALVPGTGEFFRGRLILVTQNDYALALRNGDVGLVWPNSEGKLVAFFATDSGELRQLTPAQLPSHESAFAITIHKSQGSEHEEVAIVLPTEESALLTRELVYTAVTRARKQAHLFGTEQCLRVAASRSVTRQSGLSDALLAHLSAE